MTKQELVQRMQQGGAWVPGKRVKIDFGGTEGAIMLDGAAGRARQAEELSIDYRLRLVEPLLPRNPFTNSVDAWRSTSLQHLCSLRRRLPRRIAPPLNITSSISG